MHPELWNFRPNYLLGSESPSTLAESRTPCNSSTSKRWKVEISEESTDYCNPVAAAIPPFFHKFSLVTLSFTAVAPHSKYQVLPHPSGVKPVYHKQKDALPNWWRTSCVSITSTGGTFKICSQGWHTIMNPQSHNHCMCPWRNAFHNC